MADLLPPPVQSSETSRASKYRSLIAKGYTVNELAHKLAPDDPRKRKVLRTTIRAAIARDPERAAQTTAAAHGVWEEGKEAVAEAVLKRAMRGRMDAAKMVMEATGTYVPVQHRKTEHSGEVKITMAMPRPERTTEELAPAVDSTAVEDAEVVEPTEVGTDAKAGPVA